MNIRLKNVGYPGAAWIIAAVLVLSGCGAAHTMVKKRHLDVQTRMSETIFLEPASPDRKKIYIEIRNTSDKDISVKDDIINRIVQNGYTVTNDPAQAYFMLQANILQLGKSDLRSSEQVLASGFGGAIAGAVVGANVGHDSSMVVGGLVGGLLGVVGDAMVDDTLFSMITDVQIRERPMSGEQITQSQNTNTTQGTSTTLNQQVIGGKAEWKIYRTRVVSTANQANLKFEDAQEPLRQGLIRTLSGLF